MTAPSRDLQKLRELRDQLPHLLALVDDESGLVRDTVLGKLAEFGPDLKAEIEQLADRPSAAQRRSVLDAVAEFAARLHAFLRADGAVIRSPLFRPADLVRHRRYGYRGIVVARDNSCAASEDWYRSNRTQPDQEQPWYHVLVDGSSAVTYAAQNSLLPDDSAQEVVHVLVPHFFERTDMGYVRNATAWPSV